MVFEIVAKGMEPKLDGRVSATGRISFLFGNYDLGHLNWVANNLRADLAEFMGITEEDVEAKFDMALATYADNWNNAQNKEQEYIDDAWQLLCQAQWHFVPPQALYRYYMGLKMKGDVLNIGSGIATENFYATANQKVKKQDLYEINNPTVDFVNYRIEKYSIKNMSFVTEWEKGQYDTVVCIDVLEHLKDPQEMLDKIAKVLKPDGLLLIEAPFHEHDFSYIFENDHLNLRDMLEKANIKH